jgi:hypothetical protein
MQKPEIMFASAAKSCGRFDHAGLIAESSGHFDAADYDRQLKRAPEL